MGLEELRKDLDEIDRQMVILFQQRMERVKKIGEYKKETGIEVTDEAREREVINRVCDLAGGELQEEVKELYRCMMKLSKSYQEKTWEKNRNL